MDDSSDIGLIRSDTAHGLRVHRNHEQTLSFGSIGNTLNILAGISLPALLIGFAVPSREILFAAFWLLGMKLAALTEANGRNGLNRAGGATHFALPCLRPRGRFLAIACGSAQEMSGKSQYRHVFLAGARILGHGN